MKLLLLLPDGVGIRNFALGPFLEQLSRDHETIALHTVPDHLLPHYSAPLNGSVRWLSLIPVSDRAAAFTLRYALGYAQMYRARTRSMRFNLNRPVVGSWRTRSSHTLARLVGRLAATPAGIRALSFCHTAAVSRLPEYTHYVELFRRLRPNLLFCSHQRPPIILPAVVAARSLGIPTVSFIFSWDNLSSKGRIAAPFDHYLVWSELMKRELQTYYPDVTADRIHVVGTPQFDPYADERLLLSREEFFRAMGADPGRPLICYSGGDTSNSPEDHEHVRVLLAAIREGRLSGRPQVLVRPSPVDSGARYDSVRRDYPELIFAPPQWLQAVADHWGQAFPLAADVALLANLTRHADVNVNLGSTMTLDFAIRDRPVVNVAFDIAEPPPFGVPLWDHHYQFEHYRPVIDLQAARFARSASELIEHVDRYLQHPELDRAGRRALVDLQVGQPIGTSTTCIIQTLLKIAA
jgi:hypothetical protein